MFAKISLLFQMFGYVLLAKDGSISSNRTAIVQATTLQKVTRNDYVIVIDFTA